jgi:hypothetical protein
VQSLALEDLGKELFKVNKVHPPALALIEDLEQALNAERMRL